MLVCPICRSPMLPMATPKGEVYVCQRCGGRAASLRSLRHESAPRKVRDFTASLWQQVRKLPRRLGKPCPHCSESMILVETPTKVDPLTLEVCARCGYVWFDPDEYEQLYDQKVARPTFKPLRPAGTRPPPLRGDLADALSQAAQPSPVPLGEVAQAVDADEPLIAFRQPNSGWQYIPALLGLPIEMDARPSLRRAYTTYGLSVVMALVYFWLWGTGQLEAAINTWGFIPDLWDRHMGLTLVTGFFLHASLFHLASNLYFFLIFGDSVEEQLGGGWFLVLLFAAHMAGSFVHAGFSDQGNLPAVGASAGISGVIAYYAIAFPRARIGILPSLLFVFFGLVRIPALLALLLFIAAQIVGVWMQMSHQSNVSALAHMGGLAVGIVVGLAVRVMSPRVHEQRATAA